MGNYPIASLISFNPNPKSLDFTREFMADDPRRGSYRKGKADSNNMHIRSANAREGNFDQNLIIAGLREWATPRF